MDRNMPLTGEEFKAIYSRVPKLTVECVLLGSKGVVLTKRSRHGWVGQWHFPGGTVLYRERVKEAVKRVAREELGIKVKVVELMDYLELFSEEKERGFGYSVSLAFRCTTKDEIPPATLQGEEVGVWSVAPELMVKEHGELVEKYGGLFE